MPLGSFTNQPLAEKILAALDTISGLHPGFRPVHAKGVMCTGTFTPSPEAAKLTRAPHAIRPTTPVIVRFSDSPGVPTVPDNDPKQSGPRGMAIRFQLGEHEHTDIVAHSSNSFPARTGEEFLEFLEAAISNAGGKPDALAAFLASHPGAKRHVELPKPIPSSFAREVYFAITAFKFTNAAGESKFGRYRIRPQSGVEHLSDDEAAKKSPNFLMDEIGPRLARHPANFDIFVEVADAADDPTNATVPWPEKCKETNFGTLTLTERVDDQTPERLKMIFDPVPRVEGIESAGDPLTELRSDIYLLSGRRRRAATQ
ncbi:MAG TPA: catalase family peroxidase [Lacipirellulaceae bacterium]|nr:catalase family peroxidase [Lacipirellulaceae bacterium]